jgi:prefoldin subunit 5
MKKLFIAVFIVALCAACGGSSSVDKAISKVEKALEKVEKNKGKMTEEDWRNLEKEVEEPLKALVEALEKEEVGIVGKMKIVAVTAKWATVLAEAGARELEKKTGVGLENLGKELEKELDKAGKELEKSGSSLEKELEKAAKELEKATKQIEKKAADSK